MNKKDLVRKTLNGEVQGIVPASFSIHFGSDYKYGNAAVKRHLDFFRQTDTDIMKIMNENLVPSNPGVVTADDLLRIGPFNRHSDFIMRQTDLVKAIVDKVGSDAYVICTIHGITASLVHTMRPQYQALEEIRKVQLGLFREKPSSFLDAEKRIAEALCMLAESVIEAGSDGIYFASLGGESDVYTAEEFDIAEAPFDKEIMQVAKNMGASVILHMCKKKLDIKRYVSYAPYADAVNWGIYENDIPISEGERLFPGKTILGGLENRSGIIVDGTLDDIKTEVHRLRREMKGKKFILGADCTMGSDLPVERIRTAVDAAHDNL